MTPIKNLQVKPNYITQYKEGFPLLNAEFILDINSLQTEGTIVNIVDTKKNFIAKGYFGKQNKGLGWILSDKEDQKFDKEFFKEKIAIALEKRKEFFNSLDTTAFRVLNGTGDDIGGLTIDYYSKSSASTCDGFYCITWYSLGIYSFKEAIIEALKEAVEFKGIYQKKRFADNGQYLDDKDFVCGEIAPEPLIVKENGVNFAIYLDDGPMVGVFLDQKEVRKTIRDIYAKEKTVLNTFSYTGAFSVYAALGGAKKTISVDLANRSLPKTKEQFRINGINSDTQEIIVQDVFEYFKYAVRKNFKYDIVITDPPSFARSKKVSFSVSKDYTKLLEQLIQITNKNGVIVASTNYANLSLARFKQFIDKAFKRMKCSYKIEESFHLPKDFAVSDKFYEDDYLKVFFIRKL